MSKLMHNLCLPCENESKTNAGTATIVMLVVVVISK